MPMLNNLACSNIINNLLDNKTIYYIGKKNIFFYMLNVNSDYNIITEPSQPFSAILSDDPLFYSQNIEKLSLEYNVNSVLVFHDPPSNIIKKEDKYILDRKLRNSHRIFFSKTIKELWNMDNNCHILQYGLPENIDMTKDKDIIILNIDHSNVNIELYNYIKTLANSCDILNKNDISSYEDILNIISKYKICIVTQGQYDAILSSALNCFVLTNIPLSQEFYNPLIKNINNKNINEQIKSILENYSLPKEIQSYSNTYINIKNMQHNINQVFNQVFKRVYIYEP
jgi:hypothetical protein